MLENVLLKISKKLILFKRVNVPLLDLLGIFIIKSQLNSFCLTA